MTLVYRPVSMTPWLGYYQNVSILLFVGAKDDGGVADSWSDKRCKTLVLSPSPTN